MGDVVAGRVRKRGMVMWSAHGHVSRSFGASDCQEATRCVLVIDAKMRVKMLKGRGPGGRSLGR